MSVGMQTSGKASNVTANSANTTLNEAVKLSVGERLGEIRCDTGKRTTMVGYD